ncbi:zinc transporter ZIP6 [Genypterus blacodes]|uniref:zinc transporter ZIP6 n=1 Tax=Genypterus blacodes TaxID=154954 RepID=UPI003F7652B6
MEERRSRAAPAVFFLFILYLFCCDGTSGPDCSPTPAETGNTRVHFLSAVGNTQRAEQSQRQHLEALFNRYGENGTISLAGLKRLLQSVGLDRIRSIMVQHHEHPGDPDHPHDHHHQHHHHFHDDGTRHQKHVHTEASEPKKFPDNPKDAKAPDSSAGKKAEDPDSYQNLYNKKTTLTVQELGTTPTYTAQLIGNPDQVHKGQDGDPDPRPAHLKAAESSDTMTENQNLSTLDHHDHHDHDHDHNEPFHNRSLDAVECLNASSLLSSHGMSWELGVSVSDFSIICPALLNQMDVGDCILHGDAAQSPDRDHKHHKHSHNSHEQHEHPSAESERSITTAWVGGFISITVISLLSLVGVVLIPLINRVFFKFLLSFLVALAVGTLSGDAFLHLIPHSQGGHQHHHDDSGTPLDNDFHEEHEEDLDPVWKGLTALAGVYFMFLIEHFLTLGKMYKDKKKMQKKWDQKDKANLEKQLAVEESELKPAEDVEINGAGAFGDHQGILHGGSVAEEEQVMLRPQVAVVTPQGYGRAAAATADYTDEDCENKCHSHFHDTVGQADEMHHHHHDYHHILHHHHSQNHHPHSHSHSYSQQHFQQAGVATLAWMVIMGDGLHNFSDGLAIGAAFTEGLSSGLSTSVAVFCHELPHELGDFAVLLKAGMTVRQAILYNVLSATMAYLGMVTGILIGHFADNISMWIFALTAGLFLYVALVDMVPEMLHNNAGDHGFSHCGFFLLQNAGILLGFCIMLLIAIFEHKIQLNLGL